MSYFKWSHLHWTRLLTPSALILFRCKSILMRFGQAAVNKILHDFYVILLLPIWHQNLLRLMDCNCFHGHLTSHSTPSSPMSFMSVWGMRYLCWILSCWANQPVHRSAWPHLLHIDPYTLHWSWQPSTLSRRTVWSASYLTSSDYNLSDSDFWWNGAVVVHNSSLWVSSWRLELLLQIWDQPNVGSKYKGIRNSPQDT